MTTNSSTRGSLPVAVIGAGPVGLAAAANLALRGEPFAVLEAGASAGASIDAWRHVQLFSPWRYCIDGASRQLLAETGWQAPDDDALPVGGDLIDRYLTPLSQHPAIAPHLRFGARVTAVARHGFDKVRSQARDASPFELRLDNGSALLARAVIDASGTWSTPNPLGVNGLAVAGEVEAGVRIAYGIPDVLGAERGRYAGKRVLVVGSGHSAVNSVLGLLELRAAEPGTSVTWVMRRSPTSRLFGGEGNDALSARGALGTRAREAIESGRIALLAPFRISVLQTGDDGVLVTGDFAGTAHSFGVDEVVVATGFRPDLDMLRELRLALDPALEATQALGPLIDPNVHSCGTVPPHGYRELAHPEPGFFVIGMKSYGRAPTFLMATGFEQARSVVAHLAGDEAAASRVELVLPETGVCGVPSEAASCCGTSTALASASASVSVSNLDLIPVFASATASSCCGGPSSSNADACCALDESAKAAGEAGCGCGVPGATSQVATATA